MLLAYSLVGKGFQHSAMRAVSMLPWGSIEVGRERSKKDFWKSWPLKEEEELGRQRSGAG